MVASALHQQVALVSSSADSTISVWDVHTETFLTAYKANASPANGLCLLGRDYLLAAQQGRAQALHFWAWHKDQVAQRAFTPEPIAAVAASRDGMYVAGGGASGNVYLWETGSGALLRSWPAHFKARQAVAAAAFTDDVTVLVTGGEDGAVSAWLLMDLLDASLRADVANYVMQPLHSWAEHTLPITGVYLGQGTANPIVASTSLDRSCKVFSLATGNLLRSVPFVTSLHCVTADPAERALYVGGGNGQIFEISLVGNLRARLLSNAAASSSNLPEGVTAFEGHAQTVSCLATTTDGAHLLSGCTDGSVRVWESASGQPLRAWTSPAKGPVTGLLVINRPRQLAASTRGIPGAGDGKTAARRLQPLGAFKKHPDLTGAVRPGDTVTVLLDRSDEYRGAVWEAGLLGSGAAETWEEPNLPPGQDSSEADRLRLEKEDLERQLAGAGKTIAELRALNMQMHELVTQQA